MRARPAVVNEQKVSSGNIPGLCHSDLHLDVLGSGPNTASSSFAAVPTNRSVRQRTEARVSPDGAYTISIIGHFNGPRWRGDHCAFVPVVENAPCTPI
jgi:hypothetical protein